MMSKQLFKVDIDGSLKFSIDDNFFKKVRKANTWFTSTKFCSSAIIGLIIIDVVGFLQIANITIADSLQNRLLIVAAFSVAFELAPLYIGYAICLKSYELDKKIHKHVFRLSTFAFVLGIVANIAYRLLTMEFAYQKMAHLKYALTILLIILPIITSLINIVIGCLTFDPLLFELNRLSKRFNQLTLDKKKLEAVISEYSNDNEFQKNVLLNDEEEYNSKKYVILTCRERLLDYIKFQTIISENEVLKKDTKA